MIVNFKNLQVGATFYLPQYPGSIYRKAGKAAAEIVVSRHDARYNGHILRYFGDSRPVSNNPKDTKDVIECQVCGFPVIEPYDKVMCAKCLREAFPPVPCMMCDHPTREPEGVCYSCAHPPPDLQPEGFQPEPEGIELL